MVPDRYSRQALVDGIGEEGQEAIAHSRVVIIGLGALGSNAANILARAGVGEIRLVDRDFVDRTNLQRQGLYDEDDVRNTTPKAVAARQHLERINSEVSYQSIVDDVNGNNIEEIIAGATVVVDGLDNFYTRALINEACVKHNIPWVYGACISTYGCFATFIPGQTACFNCFCPNAADRVASSYTCDTAGVLGPAAFMVAAWEAAEAIKLIVGRRGKDNTALTNISLWENRVDSASIKRNPSCPVCGQHLFSLLGRPRETLTTSLCGRKAVQVVPAASFRIDFDSMARNLGRIFKIEQNQHLLKFHLGDYEVVLFRDGRALIFGTTDSQEARNLYGRYIGG